MSDRDHILDLVRAAVGGHSVRWTDERTSKGDFDGRDWTGSLLLRLITLKREIRASNGTALTFVTHTPENTDRYYAWVRAEG